MEEMNRQVTRDKRISYFDNSATYYGGMFVGVLTQAFFVGTSS